MIHGHNRRKRRSGKSLETKNNGIKKFALITKIILILTILFFMLSALPAFIYWCFGADKEREITIETRAPISANDIEEFNTTQIKPIVYVNLPKFTDMQLDIRKQKFIDLVLPSILIVKEQHQEQINRIKTILSKAYPTKSDQEFIRSLMSQYRATDIDELIKRLSTHQTSIVLAQAALESGWGTSRFLREANNLFGIWSFNKNEPRIYGVTRKNGQAIYLRKYESLLQSIDNYFFIIATGKNFADFRNARMNNDDPLYLATLLIQYSEQRETYVKKIQHVINSANLRQYDSYTIDTAYIKEKGESSDDIK
ncbi:MAG: glucosaminidase domain-containing protein [Helicobacteraceae bacterium]|jgi:Bax protein|nr:glucosaminidase domain-containing protein [Helicobacteraceae bacterium]